MILAVESPKPSARIHIPASFCVTDQEQAAWQELQVATGLRSQDIVRKALRLLTIVVQEQQRGGAVLIRGDDGAETRLVVV